MDSNHRFSPRLFAVILLLVTVAVFIALKGPLAWTVENGSRIRRAQGVQSIPLYFIPYYLIQLISGLTFDELCRRWLAFGWGTKVVCFFALTASVVVVVYCGQHVGLNQLWVGLEAAR